MNALAVLARLADRWSRCGERRRCRAAAATTARRIGGLSLAALLAGCATVAPEPARAPSPAEAVAPSVPVEVASPAPSAAIVAAPASVPARVGRVIARNDRFIIYEPGRDDSLQGIASQFLGSADRASEIAAASGVDRAAAGGWLAIPVTPINPGGVYPDGYQTVPILAYHRIGGWPSKMTITPDGFATQIDYLARNGFSVVPLSAFEAFIAGRRSLPKKSVVITFDDGYASTYQYAFPVLKKHGFPATIFLYSDFLGSRDALTWPQMQEMVDSGLVEIQPHSKTHANLTHRLPNETEERYRARLDSEVRVPRDLLQKHFPAPIWSYAFPYGDANDVVLDRLVKADYRMAVTVNPGSNPFFAPPLVLRRTMIFGDRDLDAFRASLQVFKPVNGR